MLARYSDKKLEAIKLSIQEKQDISLEEVKRFLQHNGLATVADDLKDNIEKGIILYCFVEPSPVCMHKEVLIIGLCVYCICVPH